MNTIDPTRCPICQEPNVCAMEVAKATGQPIAECWCVNVSFSAELLAKVPAAAQNNSPALEEVMVTAQKREQSLRDVPISVSALSSKKLEDAGITSIERVADYIPGFNMTQTGIGTNISKCYKFIGLVRCFKGLTF